MWVSRAVFNTMNTLIEGAQNRNTEMLRRESSVLQHVADLERMNARLQSDLDWAKLRLNAVEKERAQLIAAAIGVKVSVPEFIPKMENPEEALNAFPDLSSVGGDAPDDSFTPRLEGHEIQQDVGVGYENLPGYRSAR